MWHREVTYLTQESKQNSVRLSDWLYLSVKWVIPILTGAGAGHQPTNTLSIFSRKKKVFWGVLPLICQGQRECQWWNLIWHEEQLLLLSHETWAFSIQHSVAGVQSGSSYCCSCCGCSWSGWYASSDSSSCAVTWSWSSWGSCFAFGTWDLRTCWYCDCVSQSQRESESHLFIWKWNSSLLQDHLPAAIAAETGCCDQWLKAVVKVLGHRLGSTTWTSLSYGSDCSGLDAPFWALSRLGATLKDMCSARVRLHIAHCTALQLDSWQTWFKILTWLRLLTGLD